jgi:hypothetical protein
MKINSRLNIVTSRVFVNPVSAAAEMVMSGQSEETTNICMSIAAILNDD